MSNVSLMQQLQGFLQITNQRQQLIASNMANVDTPGYHTQDIDFQSAIQKALNQENDAPMQATPIEVQGLNERPDGNNVNIDRESMMLSETQLQYQMGVQLIKAEFHKLLTAIKEGS
jgi:flagellar basal-body rod protein FlgB